MFVYWLKDTAFDDCMIAPFHGCHTVENWFKKNETSNTGETKMSDFYTIRSSCPQNWPIYPLYLSNNQLFIDSYIFFPSTNLQVGYSIFLPSRWGEFALRRAIVEKVENLSSICVGNRAFTQIKLVMCNYYLQKYGEIREICWDVENLSSFSVEKWLNWHFIWTLWRTYPQTMWITWIFTKDNHFSQTYPQLLWISLWKNVQKWGNRLKSQRLILVFDMERC